MTCILRALAVMALILAPGICAAENPAPRDDAKADTINLARPHPRKADADGKTEAAADKLERRTYPDTAARSRVHSPDDKADMHPSDPRKAAAHTPGAKTTTATPETDAVVAPVPFHPNSHGPGSVIDKKTATAIGLVRPHISQAGALVAKGKIAVTPGSNDFRGGRTIPVVSNVKTAIAAKGNTPTPTPGLRATTMTRGDSAMKSATAIVAPRNLAAIHDAIVSGTGVKRPTTMMATIGGASVRKSTAIINGTDFHRKPH